jgi:hypothetical protein
LQRNIENTTSANREMSTQHGRPGDRHEENCCGESQDQTDFRSPERQSNRLIAPNWRATPLSRIFQKRFRYAQPLLPTGIACLDRNDDLCDTACMYWPYIFGFAVILYVLGSIRVLRQYERGVVFVLGKFSNVRGPGLTLIFVPIQQMVRVSLRTVTMQIPSQKIITKDNVSIDIAAVAYYRISDPEKRSL